MEDTVGTREGLLRYGTGWRARLVHHNGYWCTKCTERRIYTQDEATPKPTQMRPACGGKGKGGKGEGRKGDEAYLNLSNLIHNLIKDSLEEFKKEEEE